jgi:hypothetical protein
LPGYGEDDGEKQILELIQGVFCKQYQHIFAEYTRFQLLSTLPRFDWGKEDGFKIGRTETIDFNVLCKKLYRRRHQRDNSCFSAFARKPDSFRFLQPDVTYP